MLKLRNFINGNGMENLNFEKRPKEKIPKKEGQYEKIE
jgi:hypothetical protein